MKNIIFVCIAFGLSGCNTICWDCTYGIEFVTEPEGATLFCGGKNEGLTPVSLSYDKKALEQNPRIEECKVVFLSGYEESYGTDLRVDQNRFPNGVIYTITRPNTLGYTEDMLWATRLKNVNSRGSSGVDWGKVSEALQEIGRSGSLGCQCTGDSSGPNRPSLNDNINNSLIRTEGVIGGRMCHYQDGSVVRIGGGSICPRYN